MKYKKHFEAKPQQAFFLQAKKSLGQHFLSSKHAVDNIIQIIQTTANKYAQKEIYEIGPGSGVLTLPLLGKNFSVTAIEKDPRSVENLNATLAAQYPQNFSVIPSDILRWEPLANAPKRLCVGNLPYYITSDILLWFCKHHMNFNAGIFMVQKEVAERLIAPPGTKDYGRLTARLQLFFDIEMLLEIGAQCFTPPPKVDSAIICLTPRGFSFATPEEDTSFGTFTATLFSARRKMLRKTIAPALSVLGNETKKEEFWQLCKGFGISEESRPDVIKPEALLAMHSFFYQNKVKIVPSAQDEE